MDVPAEIPVINPVLEMVAIAILPDTQAFDTAAVPVPIN